LSRQIQQLEEEIGVALFNRTPRGVELTEAGRQFREEAARVLAMSERATECARMAAQGRLGRLDIGVFGSALLNVVPRMVLRYRQLHPKVTVCLHNMHKTEQIQALREGRIAMGFNRIVPLLPDITVENIMLEDLVVAVNSSHPLASQAEIRLEALTEEPLILLPSLMRPSLADHVLAMFSAARIRPNVAQEANDTIIAAAMVSSGIGLCIMPESGSGLTLPRVVFRPLTKPHPAIGLECLYLSGNESPILKSFLEIVRGFRDEQSSSATPAR
jgi:DNA-binding transcriptional LysR family regulator